MIIRPRDYTRRPAVMVAALLAIATIAITPASAQTWPARPVRFVVTTPAGGATDLIIRTLGAKLSVLWGQPLVVDNRPGGNLVIGTEHVVRAEPDGYTFLATVSSMTSNVSLLKLPYDTLRDLAPVTLTSYARILLVSDPKLPVGTLDDFLKLARASPGRYNFASLGNASRAHFMITKINRDANVDVVHVPYNGSAPAIRAILAGEAAFGGVDTNNGKPQIQAGKLRLLALTGYKRSPFFPDTPTLEEQGITGFGADWSGVFAPAGTPEPILIKLARDIATVVAMPDVDAWYRNQAQEPVSNTPAEFREQVRTEVEHWSKIVQSSGIRLN